MGGPFGRAYAICSKETPALTGSAYLPIASAVSLRPVPKLGRSMLEKLIVSFKKRRFPSPRGFAAGAAIR